MWLASRSLASWREGFRCPHVCVPAQMNLVIGRWHDEAEIPQVTALLHEAYAQLASMGLRFDDALDAIESSGVELGATKLPSDTAISLFCEVAPPLF